jgi:catechol 2,3-dioxygenase-like lactoylglutathione lyase family enzyme
LARQLPAGRGYLLHAHLVIDHVVLGVSNIATSRAFYEQSLAPLGVKVVLDLPGYIGFGDGGRPWFFVATRVPTERVHVAFSAQSRPVVDGFHAAAVAAGGQDNGAVHAEYSVRAGQAACRYS